MVERAEDVYIDEEHNPLMQVLKARAHRISILGKLAIEQEKTRHKMDKVISELSSKILSQHSKESL